MTQNLSFLVFWGAGLGLKMDPNRFSFLSSGGFRRLAPKNGSTSCLFCLLGSFRRHAPKNRSKSCFFGLLAVPAGLRPKIARNRTFYIYAARNFRNTRQFIK